MKRRLNEVYVKHCDQDYDTVEQTLDRDHFMTATEAKDWGIVDKVVENRSSLGDETSETKDANGD